MLEFLGILFIVFATMAVIGGLIYWVDRSARAKSELRDTLESLKISRNQLETRSYDYEKRLWALEGQIKARSDYAPLYVSGTGALLVSDDSAKPKRKQLKRSK